MPLDLGEAPDGLLPWLLADLARARALDGARAVFIAADDAAARALLDTAPFFAPDVTPVWLPAWDCLPYDRASPSQRIAADRMAAFATLAAPPSGPQLLVTTVNALTQRVLPPSVITAATAVLTPGAAIGREALIAKLSTAGYVRTDTVADAGEYAVRGGLIDLYPAGESHILRLDFFGDELESIRRVDPATQRTVGKADRFTLAPVSEVMLDPDGIRRFRTRWLERFGAAATTDPLYQAVSEGRRHPGTEHYLPLFAETLIPLFDWLSPSDILIRDAGSTAAAANRFEAITDYHANRVAALTDKKAKLGAAIYRPLPPSALYLSETEYAAALTATNTHAASPFTRPDTPATLNLGARTAHDFTPERQAAAAGGPSLYTAIATQIAAAQSTGQRIILACYSEGSRDRIGSQLQEAGLANLSGAKSWQDALARAARAETPLIVLPLEHGFTRETLTLFSEQDLLGDRLVRRKKARKADAFMAELAMLNLGDLVVHVDHGIGRYLGLSALTIAGAAHDTVALEYAGGDKLYVPVENLDVLSRYGADGEGVPLDKLGGQAWQARKARMKDRIREIAHELLKIAAVRATREADAFQIDPQAYAGFVDRFPYAETEDQLKATADVLEDLAAGRPMDRLVCGDVGFGKTEVAMRAAFAAVMAGKQVAVVCPTTLLARQHAQSFRERFHGLPVNVRHLSRLVPAAEARATKEGLADGTVDLVIGTHALLSKSIDFKRLGLVVVDEEQRFGVTHKERLKALRHDVHVLTLTATPIPRTLQMALSGLRELSVIATPPVDRLAVRTTVAPFDPVVVREALLREHYRGGQSFFVVPRVADLPDIEQFLRESVPEVRAVTAHGQMAPSEIEERMTAFYDHRYDVLLATTIIESGLDIPAANTLIVHRADMFGLAQLYQIRGRVGRAKTRAYAYLTTAPDGRMTEGAEKRLQVLAALDNLGAGFQLASHDLDHRGAGNLLGDEQSGHIREVGFELYQSMLEDAIIAAKAMANGLRAPDDPLSPQISVDAPVSIPEDYVPDLGLRMALYRRAADLTDKASLEGFAAELIDRFGPLPEPAGNLLKIVEAKNAAKTAHIAKLEVGPKGALVTFADNRFPNPAGLVDYIQRLKGTAKLRPDQKFFVAREFNTPAARLAGALALARGLVQAARADPATPKTPAKPRPVAPGIFRAKR